MQKKMLQQGILGLIYAYSINITAIAALDALQDQTLCKGFAGELQPDSSGGYQFLGNCETQQDGKFV